MPFLIATLAALFLAAASLVVVSVVGWPPEQAMAAVPPTAAAAGPEAARAKAKCTGCGFIESVRRVAARSGAPETHEITVRLRDGSTYRYTEAAPTQWRRGQPVVFIAGERQSGK